MKKLLTIALVLTSVSAFATRARVTALGNSPHLIDEAQSSADQVYGLGDSLTIESGATALVLAAPVANVTGVNMSKTNAEGTLYKSMGPGRLGVVLGHQDSIIYTMRSVAVTALPGIKGQQNPLEVSYAMNFADLVGSAGLVYSNYDNKVAGEKSSALGVKVGVSSSLFYANLKLIATDKYESATSEYKGKSGIQLKGGMNFGETLSAHADILSTGFKTATKGGADTADVEATVIAVKVIDAIKKDGNNFFYGAGLTTVASKEKVADSKTTVLNLPLIIGIEASAASWLTLRASVSQDVLLSNSKTETGGATTAELNPGTNTTTYAAGASFVFNKISLDGTITNLPGNQSINGNDLLGTVGLTYMF